MTQATPATEPTTSGGDVRAIAAETYIYLYPLVLMEITRRQLTSQPADGKPGAGPMGALYIGHGAPPLLDDAEGMAQLASWTQTMPRPRGVLIVSAHWDAAPLTLSAPGAATRLVYDFGGFQPRY